MDEPIIETRHVDDSGAIRGLDADRGRDVVIVRLPDMDEMERQAEDAAERLARDLHLDPMGARSFVHETAAGARQAATRALELLDRMQAPARVAHEAAEEQKALRDVAAAAERGGADWTAAAEPPSGPERRSPGRPLGELP